MVSACGRICKTDCAFFSGHFGRKKKIEGHVFIFHEIFSDVGILAVPVGVGMGGGGHTGVYC